MKCLFVLLYIFSWDVYSKDVDPTKFSHFPKRAIKVILPFAKALDQAMPSVGAGVPDDFSIMVTNEQIDSSLSNVWRVYTQISPKEVWAGPLVNFAMAIDLEDGKIYYDSDDLPDFKVGLKILNYLNLFGQYIAVGLEVTKIDEINHIVEIAYLQGGASKGKQILKFWDYEGSTFIQHTSIYQSDSKFRDKIFYPIFHRMTAKEHHQKMRELLEP